MEASALDDLYPAGPVGDLRRAADQLRFADIVRNESKRTVLCRPEDAGRLRWHVDQAGLEDVVTVVESTFVPAGEMYVMDVQALEAGVRADLARFRPRW